MTVVEVAVVAGGFVGALVFVSALAIGVVAGVVLVVVVLVVYDVFLVVVVVDVII